MADSLSRRRRGDSKGTVVDTAWPRPARRNVRGHRPRGQYIYGSTDSNRGRAQRKYVKENGEPVADPKGYSTTPDGSCPAEAHQPRSGNARLPNMTIIASCEADEPRVPKRTAAGDRAVLLVAERELGRRRRAPRSERACGRRPRHSPSSVEPGGRERSSDQSKTGTRGIEGQLSSGEQCPVKRTSPSLVRSGPHVCVERWDRPGARRGPLNTPPSVPDRMSERDGRQIVVQKTIAAPCQGSHMAATEPVGAAGTRGPEETAAVDADSHWRAAASPPELALLSPRSDASPRQHVGMESIHDRPPDLRSRARLVEPGHSRCRGSAAGWAARGAALDGDDHVPRLYIRSRRVDAA